MRRLFEGAWMWSRLNQEKGFNFNGHALDAGGAKVLVDPVELGPEELAALDAAGFRPDALVVTNRNHLRAREQVLARWKVPTLMHAADAAEAGLSPERAVKDGDRIGGLVVVHLPGKSPGEIGLFWPERRALLLGDALIAPNGALKTVPADKQDDPALLRRSLQLLRGFDFDELLVGDGEPVLGDAKTAVVNWLEANP
jgi:glyoxylase-like metal-dependent hydrolase (beta-lactamase superfamily II)